MGDKSLSYAMRHLLLVMATGQEVWRIPYRGYQFHPNSEDWGKPPHAGTVRALLDRELIEVYETVDDKEPPLVLRWHHYRITPKGERLVEDEWEEWLMD